MTSLRISGLGKRFGSAKTDAPALDEINLEVQAGELLVLLGPSGSGKTTLLRCIAGLIQPSAGEIRFGDELMADPASGVNIPPSKRRLGMVFQNFALWPHMSVAANVAYPLKARKWKRPLIAPRVREMLELVHCEDYADRLPATLSGGQQQRIALARALAANPAMILFDEPLSNLDALLRVELRSQLRLIHRETKFTGVYVTHDQVEALGLGTRIVIMNRGRVEQVGTPKSVYSHPTTPFAAEFMGMVNAITAKSVDARWIGPAGELTHRSALPSPAAGRELLLRFRPEAVRLSASRAANGSARSPATMTLGRGKIVDRAFHGEQVEFQIAFGHQTLKASVPDDGNALDVGDEALVAIDPEHVAAFQAEQRIELARSGEAASPAVNG